MEPNMSGTTTGNRAGNNEIASRRLTEQQYTLIRLAARIGDDIRNNYPEVAEEYRSGLTAPKLMARHGFDRRYGVNRQVAIHAIRNAIRGYSGQCHEPYQGLIADRSERENLAFAHIKQVGLIWGPLSYRLRIGCHALSPEELREHCRRIAPLGGKAGGAASVLAKGLVPYTPAAPGRVAEIEFAFRLAADPCYLGPVRANFRMMAEKINEVFHSGNPRYTRTTLKIALQSYHRRGRSAAESPVDPEMSYAEKLARDPAYQLPARIKAAEIARKVNEEYHGGKVVRNPLSIRTAVQRYRRQSQGPMAGE